MIQISIGIPKKNEIKKSVKLRGSFGAPCALENGGSFESNVFS